MAGIQVSKNMLEKLKDSAERAKAKYATAIKKGEEIVESVVHTAEVGAAAFGFGMLDGRYGGVEVVGVPLSLLAGAGLHGAGFFLGGKAAPHMHGFGDGSIAAFAHKLGHGTGKEWRKGSGEKALAGDEYTVTGEGGQQQKLGEGTRAPFPGVVDEDLANLTKNRATQNAPGR